MRSRFFFGAAAITVALTGCSGGDDAGGAGGGGGGPPEPTTVSFPAGFLWGAATAGFQVETGLDATDWGVWAMTPGKIQNGDDPNQGPDAFAHVDEDVGDLVAAGLNAYRFSIEMARVYPTRDAFDQDQPDPDGIAKYDALFAALAKRHVTPLVTLHHFVWPTWMSDPTKSASPQGWERSDAVDVFATWCQRMGKRYGDRVDWWVTINEPTVEASVGYLATLWPPGVSDVDRMVHVMKQQVTAHARCYDMLHGSDTVDADGDGAKVKVSIAKHNRVYEPADATSAEDADAAKHSDYFWNLWFLNAIVKGDVDEGFDGTIGPKDEHADPSLAGRADYLGINYYGVSQVSAKSLRLPYLGSQPSQFGLEDGRPKNDLGWSIDPEGFGTVLDEAAGYGLPIVVTENGIADALDENRSRFLLEHAFQMGLAIRRGDPVIGYFHWALMDNFEWASGYCPRFGLYAVDETKADRPRTPTKAVSVLAAMTKASAVAQKTIDALPAYVSQPKSCASF
ncbi:MAG TPA: glycoside hydrolase family 1 protein [Minicystis sp.]|nr:glycoside hydrolase family 1 protein [Minicystis sp.]